MCIRDRYLLSLLIGWVLLDAILNIFPEKYTHWAVLGILLLGWGNTLVLSLIHICLLYVHFHTVGPDLHRLAEGRQRVFRCQIGCATVRNDLRYHKQNFPFCTAKLPLFCGMRRWTQPGG